MPLIIERRTDDHILYVTFIAPLESPDDPERVITESYQFKQDVGAPTYRILDFSNAKLKFDHMVVGMNHERGREGGLFDPDVVTLFVGTGELVKLGVSTLMTHEDYKEANVKGLYATPEEAFQVARKLFSKRKKK